jgi:hypothetical protein
MDPNDPKKRVETRTQGFDETARTPATPSDRPEWRRDRHEESLDYHRRQNERQGMDDPARRNQYCPRCRGVVDWTAETCQHCGAPIPPELRDYYNFSDFEPPVDRRDLAPILTALAVGLAVVAAAGFGLWKLVEWLVSKA